MTIGNRVFLKRELLSKEVMKEFSEIATANVADTMGRLCALNTRIKLVTSPENPILCGPALTVKVRGGDNLMIHKALNEAQEGDVIIVSNEGGTNRALIGEIMATYGKEHKKIAGFVFDGPIRDIDTIGKMNFHVYATGTTPAGPYKEGPGEMNVPIACGDICVNPGDIILGDADGVIVIPKEAAASTLEKAKEVQALDASKVEAAANGTAKRGWVDEFLVKKGCEIIDDVYQD